MRINRAAPSCERLNKFLYSPWYFLFLGGLTVLCNVFCMEAFAYPVLLLTGVCICLFGRDLLPIFPIFACGYISPSMGNNPGFNEESIFSPTTVAGFILWTLLVLFVASIVFRLVTDPDFGGKKFLQKKRTLLPGMLILGVTYGISGLTSGQWAEYGLRNLLFAFIQLVAVAGLYCLLSGAVHWDKAPRDYLAWTGMCVGYVLLVELLNIYVINDAVVDGTIRRDALITGWGHYNSIGALLTIIIPMPFLLTGKRCAKFAYLSALLFYITLLFTCSRGSILVGTGIFGLSYLLSLIHSRHARRQILVHISMVALAVFTLVFLRDQLLQLFVSLTNAGLSSPERMETYHEGINQFLKFPVFGGSFFPVDYWPYAWATADTFATLFPPRWHNTFVQLLATGGVVCLAAYILHRIQTLRLVLRNCTTEKLLAGMPILALLLASMVDCHFFNVGPVLIYSAILAFVEFQLNEPKKLKQPN